MIAKNNEAPAVFPGTEELVELDLCLPSWQAAALEQAAHRQGVTTGQMLRGLIQDYFARFAQKPRCARVI